MILLTFDYSRKYRIFGVRWGILVEISWARLQLDHVSEMQLRSLKGLATSGFTESTGSKVQITIYLTISHT